MKVGIRKPSLKRSFSAMTKGRLKRELKRSINPFYGKKGVGWIRNPKKAAYNKVYNKTTISVADLFASSKRSGNQSGSNTKQTKVSYNHSDAKLNSKETKLGCFTLILVIILIAAMIIGISSCNENQKKYVTDENLLEEGHPVLYDDYKKVDEFYLHYQNVYVGSVQTYDLEDEETSVIALLSKLDYDKIYNINIYLNKLEHDLSFEEAINVALSYVPVDMILENFDFEKSIYKVKDDGKKQYECYYTQKKNNVEKPGFYHDGTNWIALQNGFSLVIEEMPDDSYIIRIGDDWYEYRYNAWTIGWTETMEKEKATHRKWDFHLES